MLSHSFQYRNGLKAVRDSLPRSATTRMSGESSALTHGDVQREYSMWPGASRGRRTLRLLAVEFLYSLFGVAAAKVASG